MSANAGNGSLVFGSLNQTAPVTPYTASEGLILDGVDFQLGSKFADPSWVAFSESRFINDAGASLYLSGADKDLTQSLQLRHDLIFLQNDDTLITGKLHYANITPGRMDLQSAGNPGAYLNVSNQDSVNAVILVATDNSFTNAQKNFSSVISAGQSNAIPGVPTNLVFASGVDRVTPIVANENNFVWLDASFFDDNSSAELMRLTRDGSLLVGRATNWGPGVSVISHQGNDYYPALVVETDPNFDNYISMLIRGRQDQLYITTTDGVAGFASMYFTNEATNQILMGLGADIAQNKTFIRAEGTTVLDFEGVSGAVLMRMTQAGDFNTVGRLASGFAVPYTPLARIDIAAGTAAAGTAPLKFTAGTNLTTPVNGVMEYDGTNLYFTVGGVRKTVTLV